MKPPIDGMKTLPLYCDDSTRGAIMGPMWVSCLIWAASEKSICEQFRNETGMDINKMKTTGIEAMIDEATGYQKAVLVAWADFVTRNIWGECESEIKPKTQYEYCERCDGCGWYEGGPTIQTTCEKCKGTGVIDKLKE